MLSNEAVALKFLVASLWLICFLEAQPEGKDLLAFRVLLNQPQWSDQISVQAQQLGKPAQLALREHALKNSGVIRSRCLKILVQSFPLEIESEQFQFFLKLDEDAQVFYLEQLTKKPEFERFQWELLEQYTLLPKPFLFLLSQMAFTENATEASRYLFRFQRIFQESQNPVTRLESSLFLTLQASPYGLDYLISVVGCRCHQFHFKLRPFLLQALDGYYLENPFSSISWEQQLQTWWETAKHSFPITRQKKIIQTAFQSIFFQGQQWIEVPMVPFCECAECVQHAPFFPTEEVQSSFEVKNFKGLTAFDIGVEKRTLSVDIRIAVETYFSLPEEILEHWKSLIEQIWTDRYYLQGVDHLWSAYCLNERYDTYQLRFHVHFNALNPHHRIQVGEYQTLSGHQGLWNLKWATGSDARFRNAPAHEVGHMLGNYDEYPGGAIHPKGDFSDVPDSIMGSKMSKVYPRHYHAIQTWLSNKLHKPFKVVLKIQKRQSPKK
ncbi:MAG: hypothetical protein AABZ60_02470 [Planctomycetota bacterium]